MHRIDLFVLGRASLDLFGNDVGMSFENQTDFRAYVGGSPANICIAAQRLGLKTTMITGLGDDHPAQFIIKGLQQEGILTDYCFIKPDYNTNVILAAFQPPQMQFTAVNGKSSSDLQVSVSDIQQIPFSQGRALLISGMCLLDEPSRSATHEAVRIAREHGLTVFMDLDYRAKMWKTPELYSDLIQGLLPMVDIAIGGTHEIKAASGLTALPDATQTLLKFVTRAVVLKKEKDGSDVYSKSGNIYEIPPFPAKLTNALGAGDAFAGGFIYGYMNDWHVARAARFGNACGAILVSEHGTSNAMPTLSKVLSFVETSGGF